MSPCEAHVLRVGIFFEEDRETQKINLNYAPGVASNRKIPWYVPPLLSLSEACVSRMCT